MFLPEGRESGIDRRTYSIDIAKALQVQLIGEQQFSDVLWQEFDLDDELIVNTQRSLLVGEETKAVLEEGGFEKRPRCETLKGLGVKMDLKANVAFDISSTL